MNDNAFKRRFAGAVGLAAVGAIVFVLVGVYLKAFVSSVDITVISDRAGLLLDRGAAVRAYGLPVGEVRDVRLRDDGRVAIDVALDPESAQQIPANVTAAIQATTVFGAKVIDLHIPVASERPPISGGAVVEAEQVTTEANDVFQHAVNLLTAVDAKALNNTLSQSAIALDGRGDALGQFITQVDQYLRDFNPHLPRLASDFRRGRSVLQTYTDVLPDLVATGTNAATTSVTLDENLATLHAFLTDIVGTARSVGSFLDVLEEPLVRSLREITPVTELLRVYSPEVGCLIDSLKESTNAASMSLGKEVPGVQARAGFLPGQDAYSAAENLPKIVTGVGPICYPLPSKDMPLLPHVRFDDGTKTVYDGIGPTVDPGSLDDPFGSAHETSSEKEANAFADYLALVEAYFGPDGVRRVLDAVKGEDR